MRCGWATATREWRRGELLGLKLVVLKIERPERVAVFARTEFVVVVGWGRVVPVRVLHA